MIDEIKKLFELTQYKFIMRQDNNSLDMLRKVFAGQLSESEIAADSTFTNRGCHFKYWGCKKHSLPCRSNR